MRNNSGHEASKHFRRAALAIAALGIIAATGVHAAASNAQILVPPAGLPESARQGGEAMFLHETIDGKTLLYIEQNQGARLAALDVTDPRHVKGEGVVALDASGPFDFMFPLGDRAELVRYRQGQGDAVLDLHKVPMLNKVVADPFAERADVRTAREYQIVDPAVSAELSQVFGVKQLRQEMTNAMTGTTFALTDNGLYLIRRPATESLHQMMMIAPN
jgi:hypothetical protein